MEAMLQLKRSLLETQKLLSRAALASLCALRFRSPFCLIRRRVRFAPQLYPTNPLYTTPQNHRLNIVNMDFESIRNQVSNLTLYDLKAGVRKVQNGMQDSHLYLTSADESNSGHELH